MSPPPHPQVVIPVVSVKMVKKHKMARLLPNGLAVTTNTSQKVCASDTITSPLSLPWGRTAWLCLSPKSSLTPTPLFSFLVPVRFCVAALPGQCV